jgi:LPS export ABC transporter permease LptG/LPS export ABC transporter permease LptF
MTIPRLDTIWRYIFKEVLSPTFLGLCIYVLVFIMNALFDLAELAIKRDMPLRTVGLLLLLYLPRVLVMTIPMAILLGVLVGVGRLSTDSEIIALRASGVSYWRVLSPVFALGLLGWAIGSYLILDVEPKANYERRQVSNKLIYSADIRREIKPRVFFEEIPGMLLYADQVHQGGDFLEKVFIHQSTDDGRELVTVAKRSQIDYDPSDGVALFKLESGTTHSTNPGDPDSYQVSNFERQMIRKEPDESFRIKSSLLNRPVPKGFRDQNLGELARSVLKAETITHKETRDKVVGTILAIVHERFALPVACLVFALIGLPLGIMNRRGGRASGFALSIGIAVIYWILLTTGENLVSQGKLPAYVGLWLGNAVLGAIGVLLFFLRERSEGLQFSLLVPARLQRSLAALRRRAEDQREEARLSDAAGGQTESREQAGMEEGIAEGTAGMSAARTARRRPRTKSRRLRRWRRGPVIQGTTPGQDSPGGDSSGLEDDLPDSARATPQRIRAWVIGGVAVAAGVASFSYSPFLLVALTLLAIILVFSTTLDRYVLSRFGLILAGSVVTFFTLFAVYEFIQLIDDLVERSQPFTLVLRYMEYRSPWIIAQVLPMSCLVATFIAFGVMARFNEVTAIKASGTSIYRLAMPVLFVTVVLSTLAYVNYDYVMPYANQRAAQLKDTIRGRSPRSYSTQERRWVFGENGRLYNFTNYIPSPIPVLPMAGGGTFQGFSEYRLNPDTFEIRDRVYARTATYEDGHWLLQDGWEREFDTGQESFETFAEKRYAFPEGPSDFVKEWKSPEQMTYAELHKFVRNLQRRGYDVQELLVALYDKMAFPLVSLTMVVLGLPFCFRMGRRGSLYGIGVAIALVGVFLLTFSTTNALGGIGLVPPFLAAWAPNILFAGSGIYLLLKTST